MKHDDIDLQRWKRGIKKMLNWHGRLPETPSFGVRKNASDVAVPYIKNTETIMDGGKVLKGICRAGTNLCVAGTHFVSNCTNVDMIVEAHLGEGTFFSLTLTPVYPENAAIVGKT